jgi:hypothetical protein
MTDARSGRTYYSLAMDSAREANAPTPPIRRVSIGRTPRAPTHPGGCTPCRCRGGALAPTTVSWALRARWPLHAG